MIGADSGTGTIKKGFPGRQEECVGVCAEVLYTRDRVYKSMVRLLMDFSCPEYKLPEDRATLLILSPRKGLVLTVSQIYRQNTPGPYIQQKYQALKDKYFEQKCLTLRIRDIFEKNI